MFMAMDMEDRVATLISVLQCRSNRGRPYHSACFIAR